MLYRLFELLKPLVGIAAVVGFLSLPLLLFFARFGDGPLGPMPGGPLQGQIVDAPESWAFARHLDSIEIQIESDPPRSVRTGLVLHQDRIYAPALLAPLKRWDDAVLENPHVLVRIGDRLIDRRIAVVYEPEWRRELIDAGRRKYGVAWTGAWASSWTEFYRLDPP